jgi:WD40 repeat protein
MESQITKTPVSLDKLRQAHLYAQDWQQGSLTFVPLRGTWFAQSEHSFGLEEEITKFLSSNKKVLLLLGDSGSGKSLYTQGLASKLWQDHKFDSPIPVWISLPSLKNPVNRAVEETFEKFGFNTEQIATLKQTHSFIFILDAFDETHQLKNLWVSNHLDQWKAKIIITCRREYLYHVDNYKHFFTPFNGEKALYLEYNEMIIKPFSEEQIEQYIKRYILHQKPEWSIEQYQKVIEEIPGLKNLIKTPFLLKLAMEALPKLHHDKEQKYMTQAKLCDVFIEQWFIRQEQKLKSAKKIKEEEDIKPEFWDYAKRLAQLMHQQKVTQIIYNSSQSSDLFAEIEDNIWQKFFNADDPKIELLRTACLVREMGQHQYAFVHYSLLEYFLTRNLYENLLSEQPEIKVEKGTQKFPQLEDRKQPDYFNERLLVEEANTLQFLADRVDEDEAFKKILFDRVYASRRNPEASNAASNALTILNKASISFSGIDFSETKIVHADLTGGVFDSASFMDADLTGVILQYAFLRNTDLSHAKMRDVKFNEKAYLLHKDKVESVTYSRKGRWVVSASGNNAYLWSGYNNSLIHIFEGHKGKVNWVDTHPNNHLLVTAGADGKVIVWNIDSKQILKILSDRSSKDITRVLFSPNGKYLATYDNNGQLILWNVMTWNQIKKFTGFEKNMISIDFSPDNRILAAAGHDATIWLWEISTGQQLAYLKGHRHIIYSIKFSPDGKCIASASADGTIRIWEIATDKQVKIFGKKEDYIMFGLDGKPESYFTADLDAGSCLKFNSDGTLLAVGYHDKSVRIWDIALGTIEQTFEGHNSGIEALDFSPDNSILISASLDSTVRFWNLSKNSSQKRVQKKMLCVRSVHFNKSRNLLASGHEGNLIKLWDLDSGNLLKTLQLHTYHVGRVRFSPDHKLLASASVDNTIQLFNLLTNKVMHTLRTKSTHTINFSPNGKLLASAGLSHDRKVSLWEVETGQIIKILDGYANIHKTSWTNSEGNIYTVEFSPDGRFLASAGEDKDIQIFNISSGTLEQTLIGHTSGINKVIFASDEILISAGKDKTICFWNIRTGKKIKVLENFEEELKAIALSPDSQILALNTAYHTVQLWDVTSGKAIKTLQGYISPISEMHFIENNILVTGCYDGGVKVWHRIDTNWVLKWSSRPILHADNCNLEGIVGISEDNYHLLKQHGATGNPANITLLHDALSTDENVETSSLGQNQDSIQEEQIREFKRLLKESLADSKEAALDSIEKTDEQHCEQAIDLFLSDLDIFDEPLSNRAFEVFRRLLVVLGTTNISKLLSYLRDDLSIIQDFVLNKKLRKTAIEAFERLTWYEYNKIRYGEEDASLLMSFFENTQEQKVRESIIKLLTRVNEPYYDIVIKFFIPLITDESLSDVLENNLGNIVEKRNDLAEKYILYLLEDEKTLNNILLAALSRITEEGLIKKIIPKIIPLVTHLDRRIKLSAAYTLGYLGIIYNGVVIIPHLIPLFTENDRVIRLNAIEAVGRIGAKHRYVKVMQHLSPFLDSDQETSTTAGLQLINLLEHCDEYEFIELLKLLLLVKNNYVFNEACKKISDLGKLNSSFYKYLVSIIQDKTQDEKLVRVVKDLPILKELPKLQVIPTKAAEPHPKQTDSLSTMFKGIFSKVLSAPADSGLSDLLKRYNLKDSSYSSLEQGLRMASVNGKPKDLALFCQTMEDIDAQDANPDSRRTALHWAVIRKHTKCIEILLENDARVDIPDAKNNTALDYAKDSPDILELLLNANVMIYKR